VNLEEQQTNARLAELRLRRQRQARRRKLRRSALVGAGVLVLATFAAATVYAGSSSRLAVGVHVSGVDVGGLSPLEATRVLEHSETALAHVPLQVRVGARTYRVRPADLSLSVDWQEAVQDAQGKVDGFRPLRGLRRLAARAFGVDVSAPATVDQHALDRFLDRVSRGDLVHRDAAIRLIGLRPVVQKERSGRVLDRAAAEEAIVGALAGLDRTPVTLTTRTDEPRVTASMLEPALGKVQVAVSKPVRLTLGHKRFTVSKRQLAQLLRLPAHGSQRVEIGGRLADSYFAALEQTVNTRPKNAEFVPVPGGRVLIRPSVAARALDVPRTARRLLAASLSPSHRTARVVVATKQPARTTAEAKRMGVTGLVSSYTTIYGGDANRIHNVRLVAQLIDDTLIAPGSTFSFNATTGDRNEAKGFLEAPVIINGELETGLGGGVCQVSTTVFNAAYEAGLKITARTNHALYISHYPQGRDATVNYPDTDLKFVNDTPHWLLLRTFVGSSALTVNLYGTPVHRRVESEVAPLRTVGSPPTTWKKDPTIFQGQKVVAEAGSSPLSTSVERRVYNAAGRLLYDDVWYSSYQGEKRVVLIGTKPKPAPEKPKKKPADQPDQQGQGAPPPPPAAPNGGT
jgi:vancomycin resistance protein YoaR